MNGHNPDILTCLANLSADEVFTPPKLAAAMLDILPQDLFRRPDTTFLDPVCKSGVFLREIARRLNVGLKDQAVHLSTTFNEATGQAEPSVSWESKVLTDRLKVGVSQPVTGRGTKAQAEYKFNDKVSARAQWDNQSQESNVGNPGIDLKFRFEWE